MVNLLLAHLLVSQAQGIAFLQFRPGLSGCGLITSSGSRKASSSLCGGPAPSEEVHLHSSVPYRLHDTELKSQ